MLKYEKWILAILADLDNATADDLDAAARYLDAAVRGGGWPVYAEALAKIEAEEHRRDAEHAEHVHEQAWMNSRG
jgi:methanogenic corrinoid protein MtbC1